MYSCVCVCVVVRMNVLRGRWRFRKSFRIDGAREVVGGERYECGVIRGSRMHSRTHTHTHINTHINTHTHTHTHINTHTHIVPRIRSAESRSPASRLTCLPMGHDSLRGNGLITSRSPPAPTIPTSAPLSIAARCFNWATRAGGKSLSSSSSSSSVCHVSPTACERDAAAASPLSFAAASNICCWVCDLRSACRHL